jgi:uncharacterized damage-inducible protein DinB
MLNDSYDFVISAMDTITHDTMMKTFDGEGGKMTGMEMMLLAIDHTAHHRGQCIVYLRAKNIKPTDYQF